jgi:hypothetical protein
MRARKPTTEVVEGIAITTPFTPIRTDRHPPLRRENAFPPCAPDEAETYDPFEARRVPRFAGTPQTSSRRRRTDAPQWITAVEKRETKSPDQTPQKKKPPPPPPRPRKRRKRNTHPGPAGPEFDGREGEGDYVALTNGERVFVHGH